MSRFFVKAFRYPITPNIRQQKIEAEQTTLRKLVQNLEGQGFPLNDLRRTIKKWHALACILRSRAALRLLTVGTDDKKKNNDDAGILNLAASTTTQQPAEVDYFVEFHVRMVNDSLFL